MVGGSSEYDMSESYYLLLRGILLTYIGAAKPAFFFCGWVYSAETRQVGSVGRVTHKDTERIVEKWHVKVFKSVCVRVIEEKWNGET